MCRRTGVTLIEVLIAIFIMSIGLLALLALFPLGAVNMAQAIKDTRTAHAAADAAANMKSFSPMLNDPYIVAAFAGAAPLPVIGTPTGPDPNGPSYAVYVDPIGVRAFSLVPSGQWVAGGPVANNGPGISRRTPHAFVTANSQALLQWFSLLDDITFGPDGVPTSNAIQRENRYSWAYLVRRPRYLDPSVVEMTVAVYDRRPLQLSGTSFVPTGETAYSVVFNPAVSLNTVNLVYANGLQKPALRPGGWILDATPLPGHGYFYRVVSVSDPVVVNGQPAVTVELQNNVRTPENTSIPVFTQAVVMDSLAEVFERGAVPVH
jgi:prepilin-type N-terminal cleavage/methylation domain-containing protein